MSLWEMTTARVMEKQQMASKVRRKNTAPRVDDGKVRNRPNSNNRKDKGWEERLRLVGDARFTDVDWSGRDNPSWPLPRK
jgi:hypothetical protein